MRLKYAWNLKQLKFIIFDVWYSEYETFYIFRKYDEVRYNSKTLKYNEMQYNKLCGLFNLRPFQNIKE